MRVGDFGSSRKSPKCFILSGEDTLFKKVRTLAGDELCEHLCRSGWLWTLKKARPPFCHFGSTLFKKVKTRKRLVRGYAVLDAYANALKRYANV